MMYDSRLWGEEDRRQEIGRELRRWGCGEGSKRKALRRRKKGTLWWPRSSKDPLRSHRSPEDLVPKGGAQGHCCPAGFGIRIWTLKEGTDDRIFSKISHDLDELNNKNFLLWTIVSPFPWTDSLVCSLVLCCATHHSRYLGQKRDSDAISAPQALMAIGAHRWVALPLREDQSACGHLGDNPGGGT